MESQERIDSLGKLSLSAGKKIYFASDFHLGVPNEVESLDREKRIVRWLEHIQNDVSAIFFVGDVFDFWFEYKNVIPKGFIRFQGKIAELTDAGIPIILFSGNHDLWYKDYFTKELGIPVYHQPVRLELADSSFLIGHGDGLGTGDHFFKMVRKIFTSKISQWLFRWIHPDFGIPMAKYWSRSSREQSLARDEKFRDEDEVLFKYCQEIERGNHHDYYVFGHRHLPLEMKVADNSTYYNLGEWFKANSYLEFDGKKATLLHFND